MADHLPLPQPRRLDSRRAGSGRGNNERPQPGAHGGKLKADLAAAVAAQRPMRSIEGVDPALVFKLRAHARIADGTLANHGLRFLGETEDWTYFVLAPGGEPTTLSENLDGYEAAGDDISVAPNRTFFEKLDGVLPYDRGDRLGPGVPADTDPIDEPLAVDVIVWPSPDAQTARSRVGEVRAVLAKHDTQILGSDERARFTVVRARVDRAALDDLLDLSVVEVIRTPPMPRLEPSTWRTASSEDLPEPTIEPTAPIGVVDDEVMAHPLLDGVVASRASIPADHAWLPPGDHGTMVSGLLAYGSVEDALAGDAAWIAHAPIHAVRVLEPIPDRPEQTRFPSDRPVHLVIEEAIRRLHDEHGVRVFNLSIADDFPYSGPHVSVWTERLDELARELDVVIVAAAGNFRPGEFPAGSDIVGAYPLFLVDDDARVAEPAVAANVITVGSVAHADAPQQLDGTSRPGDRSVAGRRQPSPFTRSGPGVSGAIKPDVVHDGGNWVLSDANLVQERDHGVSIVSLVIRDGRFFGVANGTSFAAPLVTRLAAQILQRYRGISANLVRALIGSASVPIAAPHGLDPGELRRVVGHGRPSARRALDSERRHVAMTFEGTIEPDTVAIHPVPIPLEFARGGSARRITVALAFDPEVRRTRRDYLAGRMKLDVVRAMSIDEVEEIWRRQPTEGDARIDLPKDRRRLTLEPGSQDSGNSTLQVRTFRTRQLDVDDNDTYYVVISHLASSWLKAEQRYALVVALEDEEREDIDLYALLQARIPARVRVRS
jgi:Subtilase family